ncbi:MAG: hypothetical protein AB7I30_22895 [Isosphaeraceae bacterium]
MSTRHLSRTCLATILTLGVGAWLSQSAALGQHTPDPYNIVGEYNNQYEPFMYAREPNAESLFPNQNRLRDRAAYRSANRFQSYLDGAGSLDGEFDTGANFRRSGGGSPYFQAYRKYDEGFNRVYRPNEKADEAYFSELDQRNQKYFDAMKERDPRKRAQLLREYNMEKLRAARMLSTPRSSLDRMTGGSRLDRPSSPFSAVEEADSPATRTRESATGAPTRSRTGPTGTSRDLVPPLTSPRASSSSPLRAPRSSGLSAPSPPRTRSAPGSAPPLRRPSTSAPRPSSVLERNERLGDLPAPPLSPPTSSAPPPPR